MQVIALMLLSELAVRFPIKQIKIYLRLLATGKSPDDDKFIPRIRCFLKFLLKNIQSNRHNIYNSNS